MNMKHPIDTTEGYLKKHGIKPSYQRIRIYDYLATHKNHPSVDHIYQDLRHDIPTLSKTTVYNTLKLFQVKGVLQVIVIEENENRYDADTDVHGHFRCEKCQKIYDVPVNISQLHPNGLEDFLIKENHIYFKGLCAMCRKK